MKLLICDKSETATYNTSRIEAKSNASDLNSEVTVVALESLNAPLSDASTHAYSIAERESDQPEDIQPELQAEASALDEETFVNPEGAQEGFSQGQAERDDTPAQAEESDASSLTFRICSWFRERLLNSPKLP